MYILWTVAARDSPNFCGIPNGVSLWHGNVWNVITADRTNFSSKIAYIFAPEKKTNKVTNYSEEVGLCFNVILFLFIRTIIGVIKVFVY